VVRSSTTLPEVRAQGGGESYPLIPRCRVLPLIVFLLASPLISWAQFETRSSSPVLYDPTSLAIADFNHDGKLDIAANAQGAHGSIS
jgi:FG-GAP repeat